jgi:hypothetical protein
VETDKRMDEWKVDLVRLAEDHLAPVIARGWSVHTERTERALIERRGAAEIEVAANLSRSRPPSDSDRIRAR